MSTLYVDNLRSNLSTKITVPSGNTLDVSGATFTPPAGHVIQTVSTTKTDTATTSSTGFGSISGLSVSITPTSSTSKILVTFNMHLAMAIAGWGGFVKLRRDTTDILVGDAAGSRGQVTTSFYMVSNTQFVNSVGNQILDDPSSTSALSYNLQWRTQSSSVAMYLNRNGADGDSATVPRLASTITAMEIAQ